MFVKSKWWHICIKILLNVPLNKFLIYLIKRCIFHTILINIYSKITNFFNKNHRMFFEIIYTVCLKEIIYTSLLASASSAFEFKGRNVLFNLHFVVLVYLGPIHLVLLYMFWVEISRIQNNFFVLH